MITVLFVCIGEARSARVAGMSHFSTFIIHWCSDLKVLCLNLSRQTILFAKDILQEHFCF